MSRDCPRIWPGGTVVEPSARSCGSRLTLSEADERIRLALRSNDHGDARRRGAVSTAPRLDVVDQRIIEALQKNGREPFRRIAADVGVSEATIRARYARLCEDNILQVTGITNPLGLGFDAQAMVGVRTAGAPEPVADEISGWDEAGYVVITAGPFDILLELVLPHPRPLVGGAKRVS